MRKCMLGVTSFAIAACLGAAAPAAPAKAPAKQTAAAKPATTRSAPGEIKGRVTGPDGKAVGGATVRILVRGEREASPWQLRSEEPTVLKTGDDGTFAAKDLKGESFRVRVEAPGLAPFEAKEVLLGASLKIPLKPGLTVAGRARDLDSKEPVAGATVLACGPETGFGESACRSGVTGDDGRFEVKGLAAGSVNLEVVAPRYARATRDGVPVVPSKPDAAGSTRETVIFLQPGAAVAGRVVDGNGKPVQGARLVAVPARGDLLAAFREGARRPAVSDASGRFSFEGLPAGGSFTLRAEKKGFAPGQAGPFDVERGADRRDVEIRLEEGAAIKVRLTDRDGVPVRSVEIELEDTDRKNSRGPRFGGGRRVDSDEIESAGDGRLVARPLPTGTFTVRMAPEDFAEIERENVKLRAGETVDLGSITVEEGRSISGTITDAAGSPVAAAEIRGIWMEEGSPRTRRAKSREDGRYRLAGLGSGPLLRFTVTAKGFAEATRDNAQPGEAIDLVLERTGSIVGRVVHSDGTVPPAFRVRAHPESSEAQNPFMRFMALRLGDEQEAFSDPSGNFRLDGIGGGTYTVEATSARKVPGKRTGIKVAGEQVVDAGTITLEDGATVRGRVLAAKDDAPVAGASVRVEVPQTFGFSIRGLQRAEGGTLSGLDGGFVLEGIGTGAYNVSVDHPEYSPATARVEVAPGSDPPEITVKLSRGGTLTGTVRDVERQPVVGATIVVSQGMFGSGDMRTIATGADGKYTADKLAPGSYSAMRAPGDGGRVRIAGLGMRTVSIREGETTVLDFDDAPKISLTGRVLRGEQPVASSTLVFTPPGDMAGEMKTAETDAEGKYRVGLEKGGEYRVIVTDRNARGSSRSVATITVPETPQAVVDVLLAPRQIAGTVTSSDDRPVGGAIVTATRDGSADTDMASRLVAQTDANGSYSLDGVSAGTYRVSASAPGYKFASVHPLRVPEEGGVVRADLRLEKGLLLRGRVVDTQGRGIPGALVFVLPSGALPTLATMPAQTDVNGTFSLTAPSESAVDVVVVAGGWAPARVQGVVPSADPQAAEVIVAMSLGGRIRVVALSAEGAPVAGVQVAAFPVPPVPGFEMSAVLRRPQPTGPDGSTVIDLLAPSTYQVAAPGRKNVAAVTVTVAEGSEATATLVVP